MRILIAFLLTFSAAAHAEVQPAIALIQYDADAHYDDYQANMDNLSELATAAVAAGANMVVLPEGSAHGYASPTRLWCRPGMTTFQGRRCDDVSRVAELVPGGVTGEYWQAFARRHGVTVFYAIMERDGAEYYNTLAVVDPDGYVGRYRKRALYYVDQAYASPGGEQLIVRVAGRAFGVLICMDANYDLYYDDYRDAGVSDVIASMDWDQNPNGGRAGRTFFRDQAARQQMNLFVSDQAAWDSTGFYPADGSERVRAPLPARAIGTSGFTLRAP